MWKENLVNQKEWGSLCQYFAKNKPSLHCYYRSIFKSHLKLKTVEIEKNTKQRKPRCLLWDIYILYINLNGTSLEPAEMVYYKATSLGGGEFCTPF